jgi:8-amino-7-oxononanoate synthase
MPQARRGEVVVVPHLDLEAVADALSSRPAGTRALVVTDAVFSVDGDAADLAALHAVVRRHEAALLVDDAHGGGVVGKGGRGSAWAAGIAGSPDVVVTATLSKALGSQGGVVLGSAAVRAHVLDQARTFIFDTGLAPASAAAALAALHVIAAEPDLPARVREGALALAAAAREAGWRATTPSAAVTSVLVGEPDAALAAQRACAAAGVAVGCFRPPSVPDGVSRLRLAAQPRSRPGAGRRRPGRGQARVEVIAVPAHQACGHGVAPPSETRRADPDPRSGAPSGC